jgi:diguanylate cyclase (GGDEF)-like protein
MYANNSISARTVVVNFTLATITLMTAFIIFTKKNRFISISANFTGVIFLVYGCYLTIRIFITLRLPYIHTYSDQKTFFIIAFIVPTIISTLWTFGFIIMLNQHLNIENIIEKEKMQMVFNTSPDISNLNGQPTKMLFMIRDITERKLAEQKIQQLVLQLEQERNTAQLNLITDSLTGLLNRRYFDESLKTEFYRLKRSGDILSLIMLDVDYFKRYNDNYGHLAGDDCLRQIGTILKTIVARVPDIVARYGGEEFVVILPKTDENGAKTIAERIRKAVEALAIPHATSEIGKYVTVSIGVVTVNMSAYDSPEQIVTLADEAMYGAKKGGRNRIEVRI